MTDTPRQRKPELQAILTRLETAASTNNLAETVQLCENALSLAPQTEDPVLWAELHAMLGRTFAQFFKSSGLSSLEKAIYHCNCSLQVYDKEAYPEEWAINHFTLGIVHRNRGRKKVCPEDTEQAIRHYQQALEIYGKEGHRLQWAQIQNNLANVYLDRIEGIKKDNIEEGIRCANRALEVFDPKKAPFEWARCKSVLGKLHNLRIVGDRSALNV